MKEVRSVAAVVPNYPSTSVLSANILPVYTRTRFTATSVEYAGTWFQFSLLTLYLFMFCCLLVCLSVCLHVYQFFVCLFVCFKKDYVQRIFMPFLGSQIVTQTR